MFKIHLYQAVAKAAGISARGLIALLPNPEKPELTVTDLFAAKYEFREILSECEVDSPNLDVFYAAYKDFYEIMGQTSYTTVICHKVPHVNKKVMTVVFIQYITCHYCHVMLQDKQLGLKYDSDILTFAKISRSFLVTLANVVYKHFPCVPDIKNNIRFKMYIGEKLSLLLYQKEYLITRIQALEKVASHRKQGTRENYKKIKVKKPEIFPEHVDKAVFEECRSETFKNYHFDQSFVQLFCNMLRLVRNAKNMDNLTKDTKVLYITLCHQLFLSRYSEVCLFRFCF